MTTEAYWAQFCAETGLQKDTPYGAWSFGGAPDLLAELVVKGIKTATASAYELYAVDDSEPLPQVGDYSVILNAKEQPVCIIQTTKLTILPFYEVTAEHAYKEGEDDRSLAMWRKVHEDFFRGEYAAAGLKYDENCKVLCEEFKVVNILRAEK